MNFPYQHILVLGLAKSGEAAAKLLVQSGKEVRLNDLKAPKSGDKVTELEELGVEVVTGGHPLSVLEDIEVLVKNPGIPYDNPVVAEAEDRNIPIITEIELASLLMDGVLIGITGSNGKTTTTTLVYEMLQQSGQKAKIAGNIGNVATEVAQTIQPEESMVLELSSFQLLGVQTFKPKVAVLLNLFEAHLDYHKTVEHYHHAKANILLNQDKNDYIIYNADDINVKRLVERYAKAVKIPFSTTKKNASGAYSDEKYIYFQEKAVIPLEEIVLVGKHNLENILAAISAAMLNGASNEGIYKVLSTFTGVKHRLQFVKNINGRVFYNDSKATNILATSKALSSFSQPTILLAGGLDRGNTFEELVPSLTNVKALVVFGQTAEKLQETAKQAGIDTIKFVDNVKHAAQQAYELSNPSDVILLSPACASWDQYRTFEERGDMFEKAVHTLN